MAKTFQTAKTPSKTTPSFSKFLKPKKKQPFTLKMILGIVVFGIVLLGGVAGLVLGQMNQDNRQQAYEQVPTCAETGGACRGGSSCGGDVATGGKCGASTICCKPAYDCTKTAGNACQTGSCKSGYQDTSGSCAPGTKCCKPKPVPTTAPTYDCTKTAGNACQTGSCKSGYQDTSGSCAPGTKCCKPKPVSYTCTNTTGNRCLPGGTCGDDFVPATGTCSPSNKCCKPKRVCGTNPRESCKSASQCPGWDTKTNGACTNGQICCKTAVCPANSTPFGPDNCTCNNSGQLVLVGQTCPAITGCSSYVSGRCGKGAAYPFCTWDTSNKCVPTCPADSTPDSAQCICKNMGKRISKNGNKHCPSPVSCTSGYALTNKEYCENTFDGTDQCVWVENPGIYGPLKCYRFGTFPENLLDG